MVLETEVVRQLVHCDFNPKNILVSKESDPKVLAILDWEFSWVGNGLMDFGNFFRFSYDYPPEAREAFVRGYRNVKSELPENWNEISRIIDVGNMCFFLERQEDYQESFRTARAVIDSTLEYFGY
jgi:Ser/Thr protein kinase RdoA (MazF antagonist)